MTCGGYTSPLRNPATPKPETGGAYPYPLTLTLTPFGVAGFWKGKTSALVGVPSDKKTFSNFRNLLVNLAARL